VASKDFAAGVADCVVVELASTACDEKRDGVGFLPVYDALGIVVVRDRVRLPPRRTRFRFIACVLRRRAEVLKGKPSEHNRASSSFRDVALSLGDEREDADNKCIVARNRTLVLE